jgi:hypothetical protein
VETLASVLPLRVHVSTEPTSGINNRIWIKLILSPPFFVSPLNRTARVDDLGRNRTVRSGQVDFPDTEISAAQEQRRAATIHSHAVSASRVSGNLFLELVNRAECVQVSASVFCLAAIASYDDGISQGISFESLKTM